MPLQATSGAASYDAFGGGVAVAPKYIEDFFQTWLRTGTGASATVTTGLNASINKSLVWTKSRSAATNHKLTDTVRGATKALSSNTTSAEATDSQGLTAFSSTGYTIGTNTDYNNSGATYVDWQWLATPKFFDVVTWTGNDATPRTITHNLGSVPGCIIVKKSIGTAEDWFVFHRSLGNTATFAYFLNLNNTNAQDTGGYGMEKSTSWTSTTFSLVSGGGSALNESGATYVAYLFAHNAGGFGLTGTDNVISCGSYTGTGSTEQQITLGYEPQWVMIKRTNAANSWIMVDNMRGFFRTADNALEANTSNAEAAGVSMSGAMQPTATGFSLFNANSAVNASGGTYIYIAIRRGPMKVPTSGTSVFSLDASSAGGSGGLLGAITASDLVINSQRDPAANSPFVFIDRLRGVGQVNTGATTKALYSSNTNAETTVDTTSASSTAEGVNGAYLYSNAGKSSAIRTVQQGPGGSVAYNLIRAPGFMDVCCYTGTGSTTAYNHNLGVAPELMIVKSRNDVNDWAVYSSALGNTKNLRLNTTAAASTAPNLWASTTPSATTFTTNGTYNLVGGGTITYVAYLFATCPGVQSIQSYVGDGTTGRTINCGFTGGARFVCIKATSTTGSWWTFDSARGIVTNNDPALQLNSTAAEVTSADAVDTAASGFIVNQEATCSLNASGVTYLVWAIA